MMKDQVNALLKLKRNRNNLAQIQDVLGEVRELADTAETAVEAAKAAWAACEELTGAGGEGNPLVPWFDDAAEAANLFQQSLPGDDTQDIEELVSAAEEAAEEYENCLEDRDYSAEDREGIWDGLIDALDNIASAM
jgi:hypothetical protein